MTQLGHWSLMRIGNARELSARCYLLVEKMSRVHFTDGEQSQVIAKEWLRAQPPRAEWR